MRLGTGTGHENSWKDNLIVGIMSLLAIAITGMSLLIVSEYNQRLG